MEYDLNYMIRKVSEYFAEKGFVPEEYPPRFYDVRLPLYCAKWKEGKIDGEIEEEIAIEIITEKHISKDNYLPDRYYDKLLVENASSVKFFQYYLPRAKVFWVYGHYVKKDNDFAEFKKCCAANGIGLIEVSSKNVNIIQESKSLNTLILERVRDAITKTRKLDAATVIDKVSKVFSDFADEYIRYLIFYGEPRFTRREITERTDDDLSRFLSMRLVDKLVDINSIVYADSLREFANSYRNKKDNDHKIAFEVIHDLWKDRFDIEYPDIQKDFEAVLLLNKNYRDHFLHQFQVFLLGALVIDILYHEHWIGQFEKSQGSKIEDAWLACSTYHDFNYPIQQWDDWMKAFLDKNFHVTSESGKRHLHNSDIEREIMQVPLEKIIIRDEFISKMKGLCKAIGCSFSDDFQRFVLRRITADKNHAVVGAFTFLEIFSNCHKLKQPAIDAAAASIFIHDEPNWLCLCGDSKALLACKYKKELSYEEQQLCSQSPVLKNLTLASMPLAFLLAFCDVAQEWGRQGKNWEITKPRLTRIESSKSKISVELSVENDSSYDRKEPEIVRLGRFLKDPRFKIKVSSRETGRQTTIQMSGTK